MYSYRRFGGSGTYSLMMVGRNTGIELKATLQLKNMNCNTTTPVRTWY